MSIERWRRTGTAIRARWQRLERDWQSVAIGAAIVAATVAFELQIPW